MCEQGGIALPELISLDSHSLHAVKFVSSAPHVCDADGAGRMRHGDAGGAVGALQFVPGHSLRHPTAEHQKTAMWLYEASQQQSDESQEWDGAVQ